MSSESADQPQADRTGLEALVIARLRRAARTLDELAARARQRDASREQFDSLIAELRGAQRDLFGPRPRAAKGQGAKSKILGYLQERVGSPVHGEELEVVSGIGEWARRIRELRVEEGWDIRELGGSTYMLASDEPNEGVAEQWRLANEIRRRPGSGLSRIQAFLEANVGSVITRDQLDYVAKIKEGSRRVRELRDEHGWPINSHIDESELFPGEYRLVSAEPADRRDPLQRLYGEKLREEIFARDSYTCHSCKRDRHKAVAAGDSRFYLEVHHKVAVADELETLPRNRRNDPDNLVTLCHACHVRETEKLQRQTAERRRRGTQR